MKRVRTIKEAPCVGSIPRWRIRQAVRRVNANKANSKSEKVARGKGLTQR